MKWEVRTDVTHDHVAIFNENNKRIIVTFDEKKYNHHNVLIADSGSVFQLIIQEKSSEKLEAIRKEVAYLEDYLADDLSLKSSFKKFKEILGKASIDSDTKRMKPEYVIRDPNDPS